MGPRRNLLCFATGALIALAVVLVIREGGNRTSDAGASRPPERVATETTATVARSVRLRTRHVSPGRRKERTAGEGARTAPSTSTVGGGPARAPSSAGAAPRARPSRTTPEREPEATDPPAADPGTDEPGSGDGDGGQGTDPPAPAGDDGDPSGVAADPGVTIPNPATPDASVGGG